MHDFERDDPWRSDDLTWRGWSDEGINGRMAEMGRELGRRESPAFERLRDYLRTPFEISGALIAEVVGMLQHRCFADSQSFRKPRGAALWKELHWLDEDMLMEAFSVLWTPQYHPWWQSSALAQHRNAGPALWTRILSQRVDVRTVMDIIVEANNRGASAFLAQFDSAIATLDIVSSVR